MPNENIWHPRGVRGKQESPEEAGWILGEEAAKHAEMRQAQLAEVEHLVAPTEDEQTVDPIPKRGRPPKAKKKTGPSSAPRKTRGPKA